MESLGRDFCVCEGGGWGSFSRIRRLVATRGRYMVGECVKIYKKIRQEVHFRVLLRNFAFERSL